MPPHVPRLPDAVKRPSRLRPFRAWPACARAGFVAATLAPAILSSAVFTARARAAPGAEEVLVLPPVDSVFATPVEGSSDNAATAATAQPKDSGGMFLPSDNGRLLWKKTLATVSADWPIVRTIEPDFTSTPPREGLIESAWVEPPGGPPLPGALPIGNQAWPPRRQRVVVRIMPAANGAWIDAIVETQSMSGAQQVDEPGHVALTGGWQTAAPDGGPANITTMLASRMVPESEPVYALPPLEGEGILASPKEPPWAHSKYPRTARFGYQVLEDYRNFYCCEGLVCTTAAFGAGALMANTGFDTTMQGAWQRSVVPTDLGTFFTNCKPIGEGKYALPIFGAAALTGLIFEGRPSGDIVGEWGSRSLRMFIVGAPPVYVLQLATGASRPSDNSSAGSQWKFFQDDNGVSGHAFVGAIPFLAAADMVENPVGKGALYVCSTFVGFSRMTTNSHFPSQVFLGWYLAWASSRAVSATEMHFGGMEVSVVPLPMADLGGLAVEAKW